MEILFVAFFVAVFLGIGFFFGFIYRGYFFTEREMTLLKRLRIEQQENLRHELNK